MNGLLDMWKWMDGWMAKWRVVGLMNGLLDMWKWMDG